MDQCLGGGAQEGGNRQGPAQPASRDGAQRRRHTSIVFPCPLSLRSLDPLMPHAAKQTRPRPRPAGWRWPRPSSEHSAATPPQPLSAPPSRPSSTPTSAPTTLEAPGPRGFLLCGRAPAARVPQRLEGHRVCAGLDHSSIDGACACLRRPTRPSVPCLQQPTGGRR